MQKLITVICLLIAMSISAQDVQLKSNKTITPSAAYDFKTIIDIEASAVKSQGRTGTCWSFSTTSFIESEIYRQTGKSIDLSEMYTVRATYYQKAWNYVMRQGKTQFSEGGLAHDMINATKSHGLVTEEAYSGLLNGATRHDHSTIVPTLKKVLDVYIEEQKHSDEWKNEVSTILDEKLGEDVKEFAYEGKIYTPESFLKMTGINPDDYVTITSFNHIPYYNSFVLNIPDNFSNGSFYNVPLEELHKITMASLEKGYTVEWDGDVSEKTFSSRHGVAVVPAKKEQTEIALKQLVNEIDVTQEFRQKEFENYNTTDDHLMHIMGLVKDQEGNIYYKIKNSWGANSDRVGNGGYIYMSESYFKLKSISVMVHKDVLSDELKKKLHI